jgi:hypothetical protein
VSDMRVVDLVAGGDLATPKDGAGDAVKLARSS